jgi:DNA-binding transcriptional LysR family regulator
MTPVQDLNNRCFFAKVVDFGSYTAAAKALGLQTSKLSRRIAALETELGVRLINRTTRRLSLTEAGKTFHRHCVALLDEARAAKDPINQMLAWPQGLVRIAFHWPASRRRHRHPRALPRQASASAYHARRH